MQTHNISNKLKLFSLLPLLFLSACDPLFDKEIIPDDWDPEPVVCELDTTPVVFKRVAFWDEAGADDLESIRYDQLTHINYTFLQVNADASLQEPNDSDNLEKLIELAHYDGVKVGISLGSWVTGNDVNFNLIAEDTGTINTLANNLIKYLDDNLLDGVDISWQVPEEGDEASRYKKFIEKLSEKLRADNKFFTITVVSGENETLGDAILSSVFEYVDFVNIMAFDSTNDDDLHSSVEDAEDAITYWSERCLIKNKRVLGIPFYSRGDSVESYAQIIAPKQANACRDENDGRNYNGIPTVIEKTNYALTHAGGVMMKSLEQDTYASSDADYVLLDAIYNTSQGNDVTVCD